MKSVPSYARGTGRGYAIVELQCWLLDQNLLTIDDVDALTGLLYTLSVNVVLFQTLNV